MQDSEAPTTMISASLLEIRKQASIKDETPVAHAVTVEWLGPYLHLRINNNRSIRVAPGSHIFP